MFILPIKTPKDRQDHDDFVRTKLHAGHLKHLKQIKTLIQSRKDHIFYFHFFCFTLATGEEFALLLLLFGAMTAFFSSHVTQF